MKNDRASIQASQQGSSSLPLVLRLEAQPPAGVAARPAALWPWRRAAPPARCSPRGPAPVPALWQSPATAPPPAVQAGIAAALLPPRQRAPLPLALCILGSAALPPMAMAAERPAALAAIPAAKGALAPRAAAACRGAAPAGPLARCSARRPASGTAPGRRRPSAWSSPASRPAKVRSSAASGPILPGDWGQGFWFDGMNLRNGGAGADTSGSSAREQPPGNRPAAPFAPAAAGVSRWAPRPARALGFAAAAAAAVAALLLVGKTWQDERAHPELYSPHRPSVPHEGEPNGFVPTLLTAEALPSALPGLLSAVGVAPPPQAPAPATAAAAPAGTAGGAAERARYVDQLEEVLRRLEADEAVVRGELRRAGGGAEGPGAAEGAARLKEQLETISVLRAALQGELKHERAMMAKLRAGGGGR